MKMEFLWYATLTFSLGWAASGAGGGQSMSHVLTPAEVWKGFDPREGPLEEEVIKKWSVGPVDYKEAYFTAWSQGDEKIRVYAIYAARADQGRQPAVMHVHGGGQTVNQNWLRFWTERGYAALTYNWGGAWPNRDRYALYGTLKHGNHREAGDRLRATEPSVRASSWYVWAKVSRRALTYIERQPEVDPDRIGAFGVSMGGTILWPLAFDDRLRAGCAIYGVGWNGPMRHEPKYALGYDRKPPTESDLAWSAGMAPEAYAPYVKCPMLFLSGTNDHHGNMDRAYDTLAQMPEGMERRQAFTPRYRHHIGADFVHDLPLWMDAWLKGDVTWPTSPKAEMALGDDGVPRLAVAAGRPESIEEIEVFYAVENPHVVNRNWRSAEVTRRNNSWMAETPVLDVDRYLFAFANVRYESGIVVSSNMEAVIPSRLGRATATDQPTSLIYDGSDGIGLWTTNSPCTDPIPPVPRPIRPAEGPFGRKGFTVSKYSSPLSYQIGDPKWRAGGRAALRFEVASRNPEQFQVVVYRNHFTPGQEKYTAGVSVAGGRGWCEVCLLPSQFAKDDGTERLDDWDALTTLQLERPRDGWQDENIVFTNFRWTQQAKP